MHRSLHKMTTTTKNIQMLKQSSYNDGQSIMKKASGLIKVRKGQSEEEYLKQQTQFWTSGPVIQSSNHTLNHLQKPTINSKRDREEILYGLQRLYYLKNYKDCLKNVNDLIRTLESGNMDKNVKRIHTELVSLRDLCVKKLGDDIVKCVEGL